MKQGELKLFLDELVDEYNRPVFIKDDPVSIPHMFQKKQDIEIAAFWISILSWGRRSTIINKGVELCNLMDNAPHDFILNHTENDLRKLSTFKHRTFNGTDTLYFIAFFRWFYSIHDTLEDAFLCNSLVSDEHVGNALVYFHNYFFSLENSPGRTHKHIATPERNSACKRINMFLRWMVRKDDRGVDFGLWERIAPAQLVAPCDVHVERVARRLGLVKRKQTDWKTAVELTGALRKLDPIDPVKYDFALFGLGVNACF